MRNIGQAETAVALLEAERDVDPATLDEETRKLGDAISATLALCLVDSGRAAVAGATPRHLVDGVH